MPSNWVQQATRWQLRLVFLTAAAVVALAGHGCAPTEISSVPPTGPVESVTVGPSADTLLVGDSQQLIAVGKDGKGRALTGRDVSWTSLDPETATVSPTGVVSGHAPGTAQIVATSEGARAALRATGARSCGGAGNAARSARRITDRPSSTASATGNREGISLSLAVHSGKEPHGPSPSCPPALSCDDGHATRTLPGQPRRAAVSTVQE